MKTFTVIANAIGVLPLALVFAAAAQVPTGKSLSASAGLMVYPLKNQKPDRQAQDEAECYNWSKQQSGYDPMSPPPAPVAKSVPADTGPTTDGSRAKGAARGAVAGAVIGGVSGDAGKGAAIGATAGVVAGGRQSRKAQEQKQQEAKEQAEAEAEHARAAQQDLVNAFKRGMSVCLEARNYSVK